MQIDDLFQAEKYTGQNRRRRIRNRIVGGLACAVLVITTYMLILPAITMEQTAYCGIEEHEHSKDCYEKKLICGYDEAEETEQTGHTHDESCYTEEKVLTCKKEETSGHVHDESCVKTEKNLVCTEDHEHSDECYEVKETYICGLDEGEGAHTHGSECYEAQKVLTCGLSEGEASGTAAKSHVHSEDCYEKELVCEKEEHEHTLECYSNPDADVESADVWERSVSGVKLTGVWADDVISIAQSQIGYKESTQNYKVTDDDAIKGITRYGQWYGDPYGDWCAMFVSFCLNYAEIPESAVPQEASCSRWVKKLSGSLYHSAGDYTPKKGDIIFFDWDGDGSADHVGLVSEVNEDGSSLSTIEGNSSNCVKNIITI